MNDCILFTPVYLLFNYILDHRRSIEINTKKQDKKGVRVIKYDRQALDIK